MKDTLARLRHRWRIILKCIYNLMEGRGWTFCRPKQGPVAGRCNEPLGYLKGKFFDRLSKCHVGRDLAVCISGREQETLD